LLSAQGLSESQVWDALRPAVVKLLDELSASPYLDDALAKGNVSVCARALFQRRWWANGLPLWLIKCLANAVTDAKPDHPESYAIREQLLGKTRRFVIAGHTHHPQVALLDPTGNTERYFVDTGTWRNAVLSSEHGGFDNVKAITYVAVYGQGEDKGRTGAAKRESFDYWSAYSQRW
jgi:hypothetical protein